MHRTCNQSPCSSRLYLPMRLLRKITALRTLESNTYWTVRIAQSLSVNDTLRLSAFRRKIQVCEVCVPHPDQVLFIAPLTPQINGQQLEIYHHTMYVTGYRYTGPEMSGNAKHGGRTLLYRDLTKIERLYYMFRTGDRRGHSSAVKVADR